MNSYKELYFHLFNVLTDAIDALEQGKIVIAIDAMKRAQCSAEEACLKTDILPEE